MSSQTQTAPSPTSQETQTSQGQGTLTDERVAYYTKLIKDSESFLAKPHPPEFYTKVIKFREDVPSMDRTNEAHILHLVSDAKEQLAKHAKATGNA